MTVALLKRKFVLPYDSQLVDKERDSADPDIRHDRRILLARHEFYAHVSSLTQGHVEDTSIPWFSDRAWFDESIKAAMRCDRDRHRWWSDFGYPETMDLSDSYYGPDYSLWDRQEERDESLTLGMEMGVAASLGGLPQITAVEGS